MTFTGRRGDVFRSIILCIGWLLSVACDSPTLGQWGSSSSSTSFSLARELAHGTRSIIVVPGNHTVAGGFADKGEPLQLTRNVTVTGAQGLDTVLDMAFLHGVVQLCATCVFTFENITITNERRGPGGLVDLLVGQPSGSSVVKLRSSQRLRLACTSAATNMEVVVQTPRSKILPGPNAPQLTGQGDVTWNGRVWPATLMNRNYTVDIPFAREEGGNYLEGGYALDIGNMRSLCQHEVTAACLAVKSPQACIDELTEQQLAAQAAAAAPAATPGQLHSAAVAVPVVGAVLLVAACVAFVMWRRHKQALQKPNTGTAAATKLQSSRSSTALSPLTVAAYSSTGCNVSDVANRHQRHQPCRDKTDGWVPVHSITCPSIVLAKDSSIHFGPLLGAGSFGRVYRARWNGTDVAVKVIEHDVARAAEVENEVLLMMGLAHDNIVAAYHCVTYVRSSDAQATGDDNATSSDGGTPVQGSGQQLTNSGGRRSASSGQTTGRRDAAAKKAKAESHLVMEFCDCATLAHTVTTVRQQQQAEQQEAAQPYEALPQVLLLLHDVARGLRAIHGKSIVHGDLNCRNVLVRASPAAAGGLTAKLADFGLSRVMKQHQTHRTTKTCGTMSHMPPEVLKDGRMSPAMDVYAFGVMMWEAATGAAAFKGLHYGGFYQAVVVEGLRPPLPAAMPPDYAALVQACWAAAPADRPTADQLVTAVAALIAARAVQS